MAQTFHPFKRLQIMSAEHGGFVVLNDAGRLGEFTAPLFAGALSDVLVFVNSHFTSTEKLQDAK